MLLLPTYLAVGTYVLGMSSWRAARETTGVARKVCPDAGGGRASPSFWYSSYDLRPYLLRPADDVWVAAARSAPRRAYVFVAEAKHLISVVAEP